MTNLDRIIADPNNTTLIRNAIEEYFESHMAYNLKKNHLTHCNDTACEDCAFRSTDGDTCSHKSYEWLHTDV